MPGKKESRIRSKTVIVKMGRDEGVFSTIWPFKSKEDSPELQGVQDLRHLLSNEKARILFTIKSKTPESIYQLAKILGRDFKSVREDVRLLEKFGLIRLRWEGKTRKKLKPALDLDELRVVFSI